EMRLQPDGGDPFGDQPSVLPCGHAPTAATTWEQELAGPPAGRSEIGVNRFAGVLGQLEADRLAGLLLTAMSPGESGQRKSGPLPRLLSLALKARGWRGSILATGGGRIHVPQGD